VITRTYRATDLCGNHADCTQTITAHDVTPPAITCPGPATVSCASAVPAPDLSAVTANDGCGGVATVAFVSDSMSASNCLNHFVITRTYRATDVCGNHADCVQTITVLDSTPPSVTCPAAITVDCASATAGTEHRRRDGHRWVRRRRDYPDIRERHAEARATVQISL